MTPTLRRALCSEKNFIVTHKSLEDVKKLTQGVMTLLNAFDPDHRMSSPQHIKKFLRSLTSNPKLVKAGLELSSPNSIIIYNLFFIMEVGKENLEICVI